MAAAVTQRMPREVRGQIRARIAARVETEVVENDAVLLADELLRLIVIVELALLVVRRVLPQGRQGGVELLPVDGPPVVPRQLRHALGHVLRQRLGGHPAVDLGVVELAQPLLHLLGLRAAEPPGAEVHLLQLRAVDARDVGVGEAPREDADVPAHQLHEPPELLDVARGVLALREAA
eukprot:CAMPEP_0179335740 /NCGR_PEP_ID=MMETSP0797-20121207/66656_1 /TAXON_ID=47934 /ORGANISM="Dinophysis acuminata, Strain DAEP01" /LENGTH=177 /DNA_ID=CAMNT_0021049151 /DNA_START=107 /DNA_END=638 /DNA_ORIENTATION=-